MTTLGLLAFLAVIPASPLAYAPETTNAVFHQRSNGLQKTVYSSKLRAVFLAGLEGVGHTYFRAAIRTASPGFPSRTKEAGAWDFDWQIAMSGNVAQYMHSLHLSREQMKGFASEEQDLEEGQANVVYFGKYVSYPHRDGSNKVFQYTDLRVLAEMAEEEGVDLRIVYLKRSAKDMVVANAVHRSFQKHLGGGTRSSAEKQFVEYLKILFTNAAVMHSLLGEIDPAFVVCHDYGALGNHSQASRTASFISPNENMARLIEASLVDTAHVKRTAKSATLPFKDAHVIVDRMQRKLDAFETLYCTH